MTAGDSGYEGDTEMMLDQVAAGWRPGFFRLVQRGGRVLSLYSVIEAETT